MSARPVSGARGALAFLTPLGGAAPPSPGALAWFPAVGAALGAFLGLVWWGLGHWWPPAVVAAIVVALDLVLTGMLHFDGVADAADGLLPPLDRERRLAVMREPSLGAFGVAAAGSALLCRWAALYSIRPSVPLLVALWTASRAAMAVVASTVPYARASEGGLASAFVVDSQSDDPEGEGGWPGADARPTGSTPARAAGDAARRAGAIAGVAGGALAVPCALLFDAVGGPVSLAAGALAAAAVVWLARRRIGGYTGDVLGAAGVVLETVGLLVAAARW